MAINKKQKKTIAPKKQKNVTPKKSFLKKVVSKIFKKPKILPAKSQKPGKKIGKPAKKIIPKPTKTMKKTTAPKKNMKKVKRLMPKKAVKKISVKIVKKSGQKMARKLPTKKIPAKKKPIPKVIKAPAKKLVKKVVPKQLIKKVPQKKPAPVHKRKVIAQKVVIKKIKPLVKKTVAKQLIVKEKQPTNKSVTEKPTPIAKPIKQEKKKKTAPPEKILFIIPPPKKAIKPTPVSPAHEEQKTSLPIIKEVLPKKPEPVKIPILPKIENSADIPKTYDASLVEQAIYYQWMEKKCFAPKDSKSGKKFILPMPPPNVTGMLHLGHAMTLTIEDLMVRFHRMNKEEVLYLPGTDHAGISTQVVVEKRLAEEGLKRETLGREKFISHVWEWKEKYHAIITDQVKKMGTSCDWDRERFTMDQGLSRAVKKVFVDLYNEGLIYKGDYLVNWCPRCQTVLSDLEVIHREEKGYLWYIRYFVKAADKSVVVATTRPETMLGDTAVAVHPDDKRYKEFIGKTLILPILNREIPVIADEEVDMAFGSGAVKVTPAHDITDFRIAQKHNLPSICIIAKDGKMGKAAGKFAGLSVEQARENIVEYLNNIGNLEETKEHVHNVGYCERCHTKVEPYLSAQWFVRMKPLAEETLALIQKEKMTFVPDRFEKTFTDWLNKVHDWCISRQLWWGHQIPAYTCKKCGKMTVAENTPDHCPTCKGKEMVQESDVLDTWFSSSLWPFSTLGWPLKTEDLKKYYPATVLETGYDIIFFWVIRMVFMSVHFMKKLPFNTVYLHGLIRDEKGKKMSKSLGNGIDPIDMINQYGADALRLSLTLGNTPGNDLSFSASKVEGNRNFVNKLWNASRFILMNIKEKKKYKELEKEMVEKYKRLNGPSRWMLSRLHQTIEQVSTHIENNRFGEAGTLLYDLTWGDFCDWYIELAKINMTPLVQDVLQYTALTILKLWHPFIPFVTERIWTFFEQKELLIEAEWPHYYTEIIDHKVIDRMVIVFDVIRSIRNMRAEKQIEPHQKVRVIIIAHDKTDFILDHEQEIITLARLDKLNVQKDGHPIEEAVSSLVQTVEIYLPLKGLVDTEKEKQKILAEIQKKESYIQSIKTRMSHPGFLKKAKKEVISAEQDRLNKEEEFLQSLKDQLKKIGG